MNIEEFSFDLPESAIAQEPLPKRDEAKLLILERQSGMFRTIQSADITQHQMEAELFEISPETARIINEGKMKGRLKHF